MKLPNSSTFNFNLFLKYILFPFLVVAIFLGGFFNFIFENKIILSSEISGAFKVNKIINKTDSNEIAFFGSSRAEGTFVPDSLVKNGFNYGMSGTQDDVLLFFLKQECKKRKNTPIVFNFDLDGFNYSIGDISNYLYNSDNSEVKNLLNKKFKNIYHIPLFKYYGYFETYTKYYLNNRLNLTKFTNKGSSIEKNELVKSKFNLLVKERLNQSTNFENDSALLNEFLSLVINNKNRNFILIVNPYHNSFFNKFYNYNRALTFFEELSKYPNIVVLNFAKLEFNDDMYLNTSHLNLKGALAFNKILKDSLKVYTH